jgi:hypothetical protein
LTKYDIPAFSETIIDVKVKTASHGKFLLNSLAHLTMRYGVAVAKGVIEVHHQKATVILANLTSEPVTLPEGLYVGKAVEFNDSEWYLDDADVLDVFPNTSKSPEKSYGTESLEQQFDLVMENNDLNTQEKEEASLLLKEFADIFATNTKAPGITHVTKHTIDTGNHPPTHQMPYRAGRKEKETINKQIEEMLKNNIIRPSRSPWASPVVLVSKKDGSIRFCVDYRKLNNITTRDVYPLPRIDDTLTYLRTAKFFSTMDLASGYWQVPVAEQDIEKTAFITESGLYEFLVMPYGLTNGPPTFQRLMDMVLAGLKWSILLIYLDDIVVFSATFKQHIEDLRAVLQRLRDASLKLKLSKCHFFVKEIQYLGYVISENGISPDPKKIEAIKKMQEPRNKKELRSFLGLCSYYRQFIHQFAALCEPLYSLTHENTKYLMEEIHRERFNLLKTRLSNPPILCHPNFKQPFIIQTDASGYGLELY